MQFMKRSVLALAVVAAALFTRATPFAAGKAEMLWDHYGVPHIFAADRPSMFYAHGWAQMQAQAEPAAAAVRRVARARG